MKINRSLKLKHKEGSTEWPIIDRTCLFLSNETIDNSTEDYVISMKMMNLQFPTEFRGKTVALTVWPSSPSYGLFRDRYHKEVPGWTTFCTSTRYHFNDMMLYYNQISGDYVGRMSAYLPKNVDGVWSVWWNNWTLEFHGDVLFRCIEEPGSKPVEWKAIGLDGLNYQSLNINLTNNLSIQIVRKGSFDDVKVKNGFIYEGESSNWYIRYYDEIPGTSSVYPYKDWIYDGFVRETKFPIDMSLINTVQEFEPPINYDTVVDNRNGSYTIYKHYYVTRMEEYIKTNFIKKSQAGISPVSCNELMRKQQLLYEVNPTNVIFFTDENELITLTKNNFIGDDPDIIIPDDFEISFYFNYESANGIDKLLNELNELLKLNGYIAESMNGVRHQPNDVNFSNNFSVTREAPGVYASPTTVVYSVINEHCYIDAAEISFDNNDYIHMIPDEQALPLDATAGGTFDFNSFIGSFKNIISGVKSTINNDSVIARLNRDLTSNLRSDEKTTLDKTNEFVLLTNKMKAFYNSNGSFITLTKTEDMVDKELLDNLTKDDSDFIAQYEAWVLTGQMNIIASWNHSDVLLMDPAVFITSYSALLKITCADMINIHDDRISQSIISLNESASDVLNVMSANITAKINLNLEDLNLSIFSKNRLMNDEIQGVDINLMSTDDKHVMLSKVQSSYNEYFNEVMINDQLDTDHPLKDTNVDTIYKLFTGSLRFIGDLIGGIIQFTFGWIKELINPTWEKEPVLIDSNSVTSSNIINYSLKLNVLDNVLLTTFHESVGPYLSIFNRDDRDLVLKTLRATGNNDVSKGYILVPGLANSTIILRNFTFVDDTYNECTCTMEWFLSTNMRNDTLSYNDIAPMCETFIADCKRVSQYAIDNGLVNLNFTSRFIDKELDKIDTGSITINDSYWTNESVVETPQLRGLIITSLAIAGVITGLVVLLRVINRSITRWKVGMSWEEIDKLISSMSLFVKSDLIELFSAGLFRVNSKELSSLNKVILINQRTGSLERYAIRDVSYNLSVLGGDIIVGALVGITAFLGVRGMKLRYSGNKYYYQTNYGMSEGRSAYMSVRKEIADMGLAVTSGVTSAVMIAKSSFQMLFPSVDFTKVNSSSSLIDEDPSVDELVLNDVEKKVIDNQNLIIKEISKLNSFFGTSITSETLLNNNFSVIAQSKERNVSKRAMYTSKRKQKLSNK